MTVVLRGLRVLLADDHRVVREGLRRALAQEGIYVVGEALDGPSAVSETLRLRPDVLVLDVSLPLMNGIEVAREVTESWPASRVVMLSMLSDESTKADARAAGAVAYLTKDCTVEDVVETLREVGGARPEAAGIVTNREAEVLGLIATGASTSEVARQLYISPKTVKNHVANIYVKLGVQNRAEATLAAIRAGLVSAGKEGK